MIYKQEMNHNHQMNTMIEKIVNYTLNDTNITNDMKEELLNAERDMVFITHSGVDEQIVESVRKYLEDLDYFEHIEETRAGAVISSHCGPGTLGVLFISKV